MQQKVKLFIISTLAILTLSIQSVKAEDGYDLWLRYEKIEDESLQKYYSSQLENIILSGTNPEIEVIKNELDIALGSMLNAQYSTKL